MKIKVFNKWKTVQGFTFQEGFVALLEGEKIVAATSGWECENFYYVYRPQPDGTWAGDWETYETFPVEEVATAIQEYWQKRRRVKITLEELKQVIDKTLEYAPRKKGCRVVIPVWSVLIPGTPCVEVIAAGAGIDWDDDKFILYPEEELIKKEGGEAPDLSWGEK